MLVERVSSLFFCDGGAWICATSLSLRSSVTALAMRSCLAASSRRWFHSSCGLAFSAWAAHAQWKAQSSERRTRSAFVREVVELAAVAVEPLTGVAADCAADCVADILLSLNTLVRVRLW